MGQMTHFQQQVFSPISGLFTVRLIVDVALLSWFLSIGIASICFMIEPFMNADSCQLAVNLGNLDTLFVRFEVGMHRAARGTPGTPSILVKDVLFRRKACAL